MSNVFIALQATEDARPIIEAIADDNPRAIRVDQPGMVKIDAEGTLTIRRETVEAHLGRRFDLQELHVHLITISGHLDEDDDQFTLAWKN